MAQNPSAGGVNSSGHEASYLFTPITPGASHGVSQLDALLEQAQSHVTQIGAFANEAQDSNMELRNRIALFRDKVEASKASQDVDFERIRNQVMEDMKRDIKGALTDTINTEIVSEVESRVREEVVRWIQQNNLVRSLEAMVNENEDILKAIRIRLENSKARRRNSTFNKVHNINDEIHAIRTSDDRKCELYPNTLRELFSYDDASVKRLLEFYDLNTGGNKADNLSRFLAFIDMRFSVTERECLLGVQEAGAAPSTSGGRPAAGQEDRIEEVQIGNRETGNSETNEQDGRERSPENRASWSSRQYDSSHDTRQSRTSPRNERQQRPAYSNGSQANTGRSSEDVMPRHSTGPTIGGTEATRGLPQDFTILVVLFSVFNLLLLKLMIN